ncbi:Ig-like domain-containing protein [Lonsdalea quercina]|uniref:Ig-like domain-containing protein n=1 Tax=Lonsdalea quercina TaxID=71657 RepID=UPI003975F2E4
MEITNFVLTPNTAVANGTDKISASADIMNGKNYISNEPVVFSITTGSAIFSNGLSSIVVSSNSLGAVSASLVDTTAETIVIEIALQSDTAIHNSLAATFTPSHNSVDTINLLLTIDDAKADGEDQNQVELQTLSGTVPVSGASVSLTLTNGAVFISGENTAKITTDSNGRASLPFTSTTAGQSKLTAYLAENIAVYNSVTATFKGGEVVLPAPTVAEADNTAMTIDPASLTGGISIVIPEVAILAEGDSVTASLRDMSGITTSAKHTVTSAEAGKALTIMLNNNLAGDTDGEQIVVWYQVTRSQSAVVETSAESIYTIKISPSMIFEDFEGNQNITLYLWQSVQLVNSGATLTNLSLDRIVIADGVDDELAPYLVGTALSAYGGATALKYKITFPIEFNYFKAGVQMGKEYKNRFAFYDSQDKEVYMEDITGSGNTVGCWFEHTFTGTKAKSLVISGPALSIDNITVSS